MQGRLALDVSGATLGSLEICGRPSYASKWHVDIFVEVPGCKFQVTSWGSQGGLNTFTISGPNIMCMTCVVLAKLWRVAINKVSRNTDTK